MLRLLWLFALLTGLGCAASGLAEPVVADTGLAEARDGYEAAVATAKSLGYLVVTNDRRHHRLRLLAKPINAERPSETCFNIQAIPGAVGIFLSTPSQRVPKDAEVRALRHQMEQLAWGIVGRARILGGEPSSPHTVGTPVMNALP